jgi:hypothetical protein
MFRALLAHPQEFVDKRHLVYDVLVMSLAAAVLLQPTDITRMGYTRCRLCSAS